MEGRREARSNALLDLLAFACRWSRLYYYKNRFGARASAHHPYMDEPPFTTDVQVGDLPLQPGATMTYLYDFGDHWEFESNWSALIRSIRVCKSPGFWKRTVERRSNIRIGQTGRVVSGSRNPTVVGRCQNRV